MKSKHVITFLAPLFLMLPFSALAQSDTNIQLDKKVDKSSGQRTNLFFDVPIEKFTFSDNIENPEVAMLSEGDNFKSVYVLKYEDEQGKVKYKVDTNADLIFADESPLTFKKNGEVLSADAVVQLIDNNTKEEILETHFQIDKYKEYVFGRIAEYRQGTITVGKNQFKLRLQPRDRTNPIYTLSSGTTISVDLNKDGSFTKQWDVSEEGSLVPSEYFSLTEPFRIQEKTFKAAKINPTGTKLSLKSSNKDTALVQGFKVPNIRFTTKNGDLKKLYSYLNKPLLLEFWSASCPYCEQIRPDLNEFYNSKDEDFNLLVLPKETDNKKIDEHLKEYPKEGLFLNHDKKIWDRFNSIGATPTFYLIDQNGVIHLTGRGASLLEPIKQMLNSGNI